MQYHRYAAHVQLITRRLRPCGWDFLAARSIRFTTATCCWPSAAASNASLDAVWFVPAATPPHKQARELSAAARRIEMLELAIGGHEQFAVCRLEVERGGVSYTVDTLRELHRAEPQRELFFLMGADSLADLPTWREPAAICELALPVVVAARPQVSRRERAA